MEYYRKFKSIIGRGNEEPSISSSLDIIYDRDKSDDDIFMLDELLSELSSMSPQNENQRMAYISLLKMCYERM